jgi:uncharacterized membrane protein YgcG
MHRTALTRTVLRALPLPVTCVALLASALPAAAGAATAHAASAPARNQVSATEARVVAKQLLASRTSALKTCLRRKEACKAQRRAVASASALVAHSAGIKAGANTLAAPTFSATGDTLHWKKIAGVSEYVLMRELPGQTAQYSIVQGTSTSPATAAGDTVRYSVRSDVAKSYWAKQISITYPAATTPPLTPPVGTSGSSGSESSTGSGSSSGDGSSGSGSGTLAGGLSEDSTPALEQPFVKGVDSNLAGWGAANVPQIASEMKTLGVNWEREDLSWAEAEPEPGVYHWSSFENIVSAAKANGITILPVVGYAPTWTSPTNAAAYAEFVAAAVARFGPGTTDDLQSWELWNEPYFAYAWSGKTPEPEAYARDVLAAAEAAKAIAPSVKLLISADYQNSPQTGGSTPWETSWIEDMFTAVPTLGKWIDGVSVHPYGDNPSMPLAAAGGWKDSSGEWAFQRIDTIREKFLAHGVNVPFWITEEGWSTYEVSEATQAANYASLIVQVKARPWIGALFSYCLREFNGAPTNNQSGFGLLKFGTWQPKAAFTVLQAGLLTL